MMTKSGLVNNKPNIKKINEEDFNEFTDISDEELEDATNSFVDCCSGCFDCKCKKNEKENQ